MKVTFAGIVFNGDHFLEQVIRAVKPFGTVVFVEGPTAHYQKLGFKKSSDRTNRILEDLRIPVIHGCWEEKDEEAAATARLIPEDTDFVWWIDSDEVWDTKDIQRILALLETGQYDSVAFKTWSYFAGFEYVVSGWERAQPFHRIQRWYPGAQWATHRPPTVNDPKTSKPWREGGRHLSHEETESMGLNLYHYSYVYPSQVEAKSRYYADYNPAICIPDYYWTVFLPWAKGNFAERKEIERKWQGVHNFIPSYRGDTFPVKSILPHPDAINKAMQKLDARWLEEMGVLEQILKWIVA